MPKEKYSKHFDHDRDFVDPYKVESNLLNLFRNPVKNRHGFENDLNRCQIELTDYFDPDFHYILQLDEIFHNGHRVMCRWSLIPTIYDHHNDEPFAQFVLTEMDRTESEMVKPSGNYKNFRSLFREKNIGMIQGEIKSDSAEVKLCIPSNIRAMRLDAKRKLS